MEQQCNIVNVPEQPMTTRTYCVRIFTVNDKNIRNYELDMKYSKHEGLYESNGSKDVTRSQQICHSKLKESSEHATFRKKSMSYAIPMECTISNGVLQQIMESTEDLKADGNRLFQQGRYQEAIDAYNKAIIRNPHVSTYFTNRALCYMNLKAWNKAAEDCAKAAFLDRNNVKAYYFGGRAAIQLGNYNEAIRLITKAKELASSQKMNFGDEIHAQMRLARREKFRMEEEKRVKEECELQAYLRRLIDEDVRRQVEAVLSAESSAESDRDEERNQNLEQITQLGEQHKAQLDALFAQVDDRRRKREIPDFLCGKISCALLQDPVITPSGITYDRADIKQHLHRVGHFDPVTRAPLTESDLIPNLAMKEVLEHFLIENPWAKYEDLLS